MRLDSDRFFLGFGLLFVLFGSFSLGLFIKEKRSERYPAEVRNWNSNDVASVTVKIRYSNVCLGRVTINTDEFEPLFDAIKSYSVLENQSDRLSPVEVFEVKMLFVNGDEPICFLLFNSQKYGGVVRFCGNCNTMPKSLDVKNEELLNFIHKKCAEKE